MKFVLLIHSRKVYLDRGSGMTLSRQQVITLTIGDPAQWCTYTSSDFKGLLTHWGQDTMAAIFQMTFSNALSWMKMYKFRVRFHWNLFPRVGLTIFRALVQIMAWRRSGDKPLSEPVLVSLLTHICVTRPQWVNAWSSIVMASESCVSYVDPLIPLFMTRIIPIGLTWIFQKAPVDIQWGSRKCPGAGGHYVWIALYLNDWMYVWSELCK